jgi:hypothetical protein
MASTKLNSVREENQPQNQKEQSDVNSSNSISCIDSLIDENLEQPLV